VCLLLSQTEVIIMIQIYIFLTPFLLKMICMRQWCSIVDTSEIVTAPDPPKVSSPIVSTANTTVIPPNTTTVIAPPARGLGRWVFISCSNYSSLEWFWLIFDRPSLSLYVENLVQQLVLVVRPKLGLELISNQMQRLLLLLFCCFYYSGHCSGSLSVCRTASVRNTTALLVIFELQERRHARNVFHTIYGSWNLFSVNYQLYLSWISEMDVLYQPIVP
jgi:hypothetical protein